MQTRHKFKKALGQNFLRSDRFAIELVNTVAPEFDELIIEVGPGDGRVTRIALETGAQVVCIEVDYSLIPKLIAKFRDYENFELIHESVLDVDITEVLKQFPDIRNYKVIGSLPYNISKQIIRKFLTLEQPPSQMAFIVQEEVAKAYVAKPPKATFLSSWVQIFANAKKRLSIPKTQFFPTPKVNGAILELNPNTNLDKNSKAIAKVMKVGFTSPRKTLRNNFLSTWHERTEQLDMMWEQVGLSEKARAAELEFNTWVHITEFLIEQKVIEPGDTSRNSL